MATAARHDYPHIVKTPGVRGGKARIDGTRICVVDLVWLQQAGKTPAEMQEYYSDRPLTLAEVHSALAYYYDYPDEIEAAMAADGEREVQQERAKSEYPTRRTGP
jgi:uncharacterized protein (DUF433 family)